MELNNAFAVTGQVDQVWTTLMDVDKVTACLPGAQVLQQLSEDEYQVAMKVRLGPVTMQYRGDLQVVERDQAGHRAVLQGKAKETRGQGTASATVEMQLHQDGDQTQGTVHADLRLSGRAAAMGAGVIGGVAEQMMAQFSKNLQALLNEPDGAGAGAPAGSEAVEAMGEPSQPSRSGDDVAEGVETASAGTQHGGVIEPPEEMESRTAPVERVRGDKDMTEGQVVHGPGASGGPGIEVPEGRTPEADVSAGAQTIVGGRVSDRVSASDARPPAPPAGTSPGKGRTRAADRPRPAGVDDSLDALALARSVALARLQQPRALLGLVTAVALLAFRAGRRSGARSRRATRRGFRPQDVQRLAQVLQRERKRG